MNAAQMLLLHQVVAINRQPVRPSGLIGGAGTTPEPENNRKVVVVASLGLLAVVLIGTIALLHNF